MKIPLREILFALLLLGIPTGSWWLAFRPANERHKQMCRQIESKQAKLRKLNQLMNSVGELKDEIQSLQKAIDFFESRLPCEKEIEKVLRETWRLAETNKLVTKSIRAVTTNQINKQDDVYASGSYAEQRILINLEGDFLGFYSFLQSLENQPRILRISRMNLSKVEKAREGYIRASFEMSVFFDRDRKDETWPEKS